jgi:hypothetical protein
VIQEAYTCYQIRFSSYKLYYVGIIIFHPRSEGTEEEEEEIIKTRGVLDDSSLYCRQCITIIRSMKAILLLFCSDYALLSNLGLFLLGGMYFK